MVALLRSKQWGIPVVYGWCIIAGLFQSLINLPIGSMFMLRAPAHLRGRGFALFQAAITTWMICGIMLGGWIARENGVLHSMIAAGTILIATAFAYACFRKKSLLVQEGA